MPALTFDDLIQPQGQGGDGVTRLTVTPARPQSRALTFDDLIAPESTGAKVGRYAEDVGRSVVSGLDKGVAGLAGLPADIAGWIANGADYVTSRVTGRPQEEIAQEADARALIPRSALEPYTGAALHKNSGLAYDPQTTAGKYAETAASFVPAAVLGPGSAARNAVTWGVIPGLASETAGQATQGTGLEPYARVGAAIGAGGAASLLSRPGSAAQAIRQQLPEGITPQHVNAAEQLMQDAAQRGIQLTWPEALSQVAGRPVMSNLMRHLEAAPQTEGRMAEFYGARPQQVENAARPAFDRLAPVNNNPSSIGPAVGQEAEGFVDNVRQSINRLSEPSYQAAEGVLLNPQQMAQVRAIPGYAEAAAAVRNEPQLNRYVSHLPENSVGFLNEVKKQLDQSATNARAPISPRGAPNAQIAAGYTQDAAAVRQAGVNASPDYARALAIQEQGRAQFLDPILQGPIGQLAKRDLTTQNAINALFPQRPVANSAAEIADSVGALAQRSPRVASDLVRAHVETAFNTYARGLQTGANQAGGAKFANQLAGNAQQRANLQAAVEALPNGAERWRGFNRLLEILEATGTRQNVGSRTAYNEQFLRDASMSGVAGETMKAAGQNPLGILSGLADKYERYRLGQNLNELADILTRPGAANQLRAIARMNPNSPAARNTAYRLLSTTRSSTSERQ